MKYTKLQVLNSLFLLVAVISIFSCEKVEELKMPTVYTREVSEVTALTAISGGDITDDAGSTITARGICWSTETDPTITDSKTLDGAGGGTFSSTLTDLLPNNTYFIRAYATNANGTGYGMTLSFTTLDGVSSITTGDASEITATTAQIVSNINDDGGSEVTSRGVCWSLSENPSINDNYTSDGSGLGSFTSNLTELVPGNNYYARAYATNNVGTSYGNQISFATLDGVIAITTAEVTSITEVSAVSGGNVIDDGGAEVTARGIVWSISENPTLSINSGYTEDGSGLGEFTSHLTGLVEKTKYYVRAYATNVYGVVYGNQISFETPVADGTTGSVVYQGYTYQTVYINNREWFAENLRTTKYEDGTDIPNVTDRFAWKELNSGAYCWKENDEIINKEAYGALYNWYAVENGGLCPIGWHVPTNTEWSDLLDYVGGISTAGGRLRGTRTEPDAHPRWNSPVLGAYDVYGFSAYPGGGLADWDGAIIETGFAGYWWSSSVADVLNSFFAVTYYTHESMSVSYAKKWYGFSVRCIKD